jgi:hypothetical protein
MTDADTRRGGTWRLADGTQATAKQLAPRLAGREPVADLCYRGVHLRVGLLDARVPDDPPNAARLYRFCVLRPVVWPALLVPLRRRLPREWRSAGVLVYASRHGDRFAALADLEVVFATRSLLYSVERFIDEVYRQGESPRRGAACRGVGDRAEQTGRGSELPLLRPQAGAASLALT